MLVFITLYDFSFLWILCWCLPLHIFICYIRNLRSNNTTFSPLNGHDCKHKTRWAKNTRAVSDYFQGIYAQKFIRFILLSTSISNGRLKFQAYDLEMNLKTRLNNNSWNVEVSWHFTKSGSHDLKSLWNLYKALWFY